MMKTLSLLLSALMLAGLEAFAFDGYGPPIEAAGSPTATAYQEWNDNTATNSDVSKKRRKKKRKKSKSRRGGGGSFEQGAKVVSLGYGAPNMTKTMFKTWEIMEGFSLSGVGPAHAKFEYGIGDKVGLGLSVNFVQTKTRWTEMDFFGMGQTYTEGFDYMGLAANVRFNYHFVTSDQLDVYVGAGAGYSYADYTYYTDYEGATPLSLSIGAPFGFETSLGARYYFTDNIGAYIEMGFAKSLVQGGLTIKF